MIRLVAKFTLIPWIRGVTNTTVNKMKISHAWEWLSWWEVVEHIPLFLKETYDSVLKLAVIYHVLPSKRYDNKKIETSIA